MDKIILTEQSNENTKNIDIVSTLELVEMINNEDKKVALAIEAEKEHIANAIDLITKKILQGGHLLYFGAGTSGRLGVLDASECPPTFGVSDSVVKGFIAGGDIALRNAIEGAEDNFEQGEKDLINANTNSNDIIIGISSSGNPKWLLGVLGKAKELNLSTISITCNPNAKIKNLSDISICPVVGQECITGSSRMKAGTAQKMVLNMLSTGLMIKIGKTYGNYMIDVQPTNEKLKQRAIRFVTQIAQTNEETAKKLLEQTNYEVKTAIVVLLNKISIADAGKLLNNNNGILRKVIKRNDSATLEE